jgi:hypothetical protein
MIDAELRRLDRLRAVDVLPVDRLLELLRKFGLNVSSRSRTPKGTGMIKLKRAYGKPSRNDG